MRYKVIFWITTLIIVGFDGVLPALTFNSEMARQGITHLGYPVYFGQFLALFKVIGVIVLAFQQVFPWIKEWAYAGFAFDFIFAFLSTWAVDGLTGMTFFPIIFLGLLIVSYVAYHKTYAIRA